MKAYLQVFVNFKQNDRAKFLLMAKFASNNVKNACTGYTSFELNCDYHLWMLYKKEVNFYLQSKTAYKVLTKLKELIIVYCKNLYYAQRVQKHAHNKSTKPKSFALGNKI